VTEAVPQSSHFVLPELAQIERAVCEVMQFALEEEVIGRDILQLVGQQAGAGAVSPQAVVHAALYADALYVAEQAILADGAFTDEELSYVTPLLEATLGALQPFRVSSLVVPASADARRSLMSRYARDLNLFGGSCDTTRFLGLTIVRRVADESRDREPVDHYIETMVRLAEEIFALDTRPGTVELARSRFEARVDLRGLLARAEQDAPSTDDDPRIRAFCSPESPDVFHAIAQAHQVFQRDAFDVDIVHQEARLAFARLLDQALDEGGPGAGKVFFVFGAAGSGKTHLLRAFRERTHAERSGYVGYAQMSAVTSDYSRYILGNLLDSLEKPYDDPVVQEAGLYCLSDALLLAPVSITPEHRRRLRDEELADDELCNLVFELADAVVRDPRFRDIDLDVLRALLFLQRRDPAIYARVLKYLRCEPMNRRDLAPIGDLSPKVHDEDPLRVILQLAKVIAQVGGGALVLLVDQVEDLLYQSQPGERFIKLMDTLRHLSDHAANVVVVVSCHRDFYKEMRGKLTKSVLDRVERNPAPVDLRVDRSRDEIERLVARRLQVLYAHAGARYRPEEPFFPFPRAVMEKLTGLSARDAFAFLHEYQTRCVGAGHLVAETTVSSVPPPPAIPAKLDLSQAWTTFRATSSPPVDLADDALLALLGRTIEAVRYELAETAPTWTRDGASLLVEWVRPHGSERSYVCLANKSTRGGGLSRQLDQLLSSAEQHHMPPVAVRCSEFASGNSGPIAERLGRITRAGGRRVLLDSGSLRTLHAYVAFAEKHGSDPGYAAWARDERPLLSVDVFRTLLTGRPNEPKPAPREVNPPLNVVETPTPAVALPPPEATDIHPAATRGNELAVGTTLSVARQAVLLDREQLKRHAAFLGATGSGKTSLALNLIEQLASSGVGALLVDRKGDLAAYMDPRARATEEPDPARARRRAELFAQLHVRLFTPGDPDGRPLQIRTIPSGLDALPPTERTQIAEYAARGLATMMGFSGRATDNAKVAILTKAIEIVGQSVAGRPAKLEDVISLIYEEDESLLAAIGHLDPKYFPKLLTDLETLRITQSLLLAADGEQLSAQNLLGVDGSTPAGKVPLTIVSTKFLRDAQAVDFWVSQMLVELSRYCSKSPSPALRSVMLLDEADAYLPATSKPATKAPLMDLLKRARSAGLGVMLATQNPGDLDYKARDNIGTWWIGRIATSTAIQKMKPLLSECRTDVSGSLANAATGEFFQVHDGAATRLRGQRSLIDTQQLSEARISELARLRG
jgi:Helicase HerA, central domain